MGCTGWPRREGRDCFGEPGDPWSTSPGRTAVELTANRRLLRLPVVGIIRDFPTARQPLFPGAQRHIRAFQDDTIDLFRLYLQPGARPRKCRSRIMSAWADSAACLSVQPRGAGVRQEADRQLVRAHLHTDLRGRDGGHSGHRQHAHGFHSDGRRELGRAARGGRLRALIRGTIWLEAIAIA